MTALPNTKTCTYCQCAKPLTEFGKHKLGKHGLNPQCKQCNRERVAAYQAEHGEAYKARKLAYDKQRWAEGHGRQRREWREANKEHVDRKRLEWTAGNPEKVAAIKQNYKHRRRSKERNGMTWAELMEWKRSQEKVCHWCGADCKAAYHADHYVPLAKGGKHEASNLVVACPPCNLRKSARDPLDFKRDAIRKSAPDHYVPAPKRAFQA